MRRSAAGVTLAASSASSRPRLPSSGGPSSSRADRRAGSAPRIRPNLNSSSSRSSSWPSRSAAAAVASTASSSAASARSRGDDQRLSAMLVTRSRVGPETRPSSSRRARPFLASVGLVASVSARRTPGSRSSRWVTANRSSPSIAGSAPAASAAVSFSRAMTNDPRLAPLIAAPPANGPSPPPQVCGWSSGCPFGLLIQLVQEALNDAPLPGLIGQRLAHHAAGQVHREPADLGLERLERLLPVGLDLRVRHVDQAAALRLRLLAHLGDDLRALLPRLLAQPGGLVPGLGQLFPVLGEGGVRLGLGFLGPLQAALDLVGPLLQRLVEPRHQDLPEREEDDAERDRAHDELGEVGDQWVLKLFGRLVQHGGYLPVGRYLVLRKNGTAMPISASASVSAKPIHM